MFFDYEILRAKRLIQRFVPISSILLTIFITTPSYASDLFAPHVEYQTGSMPHSVKIADFNGDNKIDIAVLDFGYYSSVSILIGNGDGTFQEKKDFNVGIYTHTVTVGDFNGDGKTDLVVGKSWGNTVSLFIGNGDGTFQAARDIETGWQPYSITVGDFDRDDKTDMAVLNAWYGISGVSILIGNGDGTFQPKRDFGVEALHPASITNGDFNGDGITDLATANYQTLPYSVSILIGNGDGSFKLPQRYATEYFPWDLIAQDFNADGRLDLATVNKGGSSISILIGNGDGTFKPRVDYNGGVAVTAGDYNSDGKIDLATANGRNYTVSVLIGNGDGTFQVENDYGTGKYPNFISTADFNADGMADLVTANTGSGTVSILLNKSNKLPIANAGTDQTIECAGPSGASLTLDGSASSDPDGDQLTYTWTWDGGSAKGVSPTVSLPLGVTVITLAVSDGKTTATDTISIAVQDTTPPVTTATGGSGNWYNANVISTFSATDSCSGVKEIHYTVTGAETVVLGSSVSVVITSEGINTITYYAVDNAGNIESPNSFTVKIDKMPPTLNLNTNPSILWPPDHKMIDVMIGGGATDAISGLASIAFTVADEYGIVQPSISDFNTTIPLEAWREGTDQDGRKYTIMATATDVAGNNTTMSTQVFVPHDQR